ncbi:MAG: enoyl-CoA hydratase-related protein [Rubricoccaceae bacterium]|nr:enoyl-CoA hydratase-related protein [Rubricoccaceae bacterium]
MSTYSTLEFTTDGDGIAVITLNRPEQLNALSKEVLRELEDVFGKTQSNASIRAIILTGSGEKAFAAGADIREFTGMTAEDGELFAKGGQRVFSLIEGSRKPIIAAINGYALGGGCELAMACHIRIASENARFGQPEVNLGLIPGYGGTQRLTKLVGRGIATELIVTATQISAQRAYEIGLVNHVCSQEALMSVARDLAVAVATKAPLAVAHALEAVAAATRSEEEGMAAEARLFANCCGTEDFKEGVEAFLNRRDPDFLGR